MAREIKVNIVGDSRGYSKALNSATKSSSSFGKSITKVAKIAAIGLGAGLAVAAIGLKKSVDAAQEAQVSLLKLQAQMKASGLSYEKFGKQIEETIDAQSRLAAVDDEELQDSFTNILRIVPNVSRALELNALAADISRAKGLDLAKAGELVGKVAGGNTGILSRYGIQLEEGATAQEALAVLQEKFGGQAEAYGSSVAGAGDRVRVAMENVAETIGTMVFPLAERVLGAFTKALEGVQDFADRIAAVSGFKAKFRVAFTGIKGAAQDVWDEFADLITGTSKSKPLKLKSGKIIEWEAPAAGLAKQIQDGIKSTDWGAIGKTIGENITSKVKITAEFLGDVLTAANEWIDAHLDEFADLGAKMLLAIVAKLTDPKFWIENWKLVLGVAVAVFPMGRVASLGKLIGGALGRPVVRFFAEQLGRLPAILQRVVGVMLSGIKTFASQAWQAIKTQFGKIPGIFRAAFRLSVVLGFFNALKNLVMSLPGVVGGAARGAVNAAIDAFNALGDFTIEGPGPLPDIHVNIPDIPHVATGGHVMRSGLAVIHKGEDVIPARNGSSGGRMQLALVAVGPDILRELRELERRGRMGGSLA